MSSNQSIIKYINNYIFTTINVITKFGKAYPFNEYWDEIVIESDIKLNMNAYYLTVCSKTIAK